MNEFNKYKLLSEGKAFGDRAKIALVLLDSNTAYEELKVEGAQTSVSVVDNQEEERKSVYFQCRKYLKSMLIFIVVDIWNCYI